MFTISVWMRLCISGVGSSQPVDVPGDSGSPSANMLSPIVTWGAFPTGVPYDLDTNENVSTKLMSWATVLLGF